MPGRQRPSTPPRLPSALWQSAVHLNDEVQKVANKYGIISEIEHQSVDAAKIGGLAAWTFNPSFDNSLSRDSFLQQSCGVHSVVHPASAQRDQGLSVGRGSSYLPAELQSR